MTASGDWVSLFSGGKDSAWALYRALEEGLNVTRLLTVHPSEDSFMYHVPATHLTSLAAESVGIEHVEVYPEDFDAPNADDATAQGDAELEPLEAALEELRAELELAGITAGAIESEYQTSRIRGMCDRLGIDLFAPLWQEDPRELGEAMLDAGFEITILQVAADGLDESWVGRTLDAAALDELTELHEEYGVHVLGEGGEFETFVTDGPHMSRPVELEYETVWEGTRGYVEITDAFLG
ncbi:metal-binding-domain/4Fe-4S-binding-domain containing ABC transporter, ATP-binding protein [Halopelagius inordinatus]|uniref:Metal-binding-domain/4Fe-4S-binding-domain containing ABC transporter, ATP-binding protein n=1 Tax=Halopelagius inordinatus TaxID=553467 RepID=A0A1I2NBX2_9EURY|nr:diphthine--ammonia ligase [Halopelagius inordinatus]SFF98861.1 metal-binding-domain/4Fe-4S-binding-domain containing ABC transporter, ATP-binding protein [Halopelagius inordinatus]